MGQQSAEPPEHAPQHTDLQQHEQQHQPEAAEDRVDDALLTLFQEPEAAVLELLHPVFHVLLKFFFFHSFSFRAEGDGEHPLGRVAVLHQLLSAAGRRRGRAMGR